MRPRFVLTITDIKRGREVALAGNNLDKLMDKNKELRDLMQGDIDKHPRLRAKSAEGGDARTDS